MADVITNSSVSIELTEEEKEILSKAGEICNGIGNDIWRNGNGTDEEDEVSFFFSSIGGSIENALKGRYWTP